MFPWGKTVWGLAWASGAILLAHPQGVAGECIPDTLTIELSNCLEVGSELVAPIALSNASERIVGGQFFIEYSTSTFELISVTPGEDPFTQQIHFEEPGPGLIDYAVIAFLDGTMEDTVMAVMTFLVIGDEGGAPFIRFRPHEPSTTMLAGKGGAVPPHTVDAGEVEDVDLTDVAVFQNCFGGAGVEMQPACTCPFDFDEDLDVDLGDYEALHAILEGPISWYCEKP